MIGWLTCTDLHKANTCLGIDAYMHMFFQMTTYRGLEKVTIISSSFVTLGRLSEIHAEFFDVSILKSTVKFGILLG